jgi:uncharacterized protein (TIGR03083 family)
VTLERADILRFIEAESAAAASTISPSSLEARVPSCPDWSLTELIWHLGRVQRFWATTVHAGELDPEFPAEETGPSDARELDAWLRASTRELLDALEAVPWDTPAWTWWKDDRTVGAIARHQVQEAAVHRWDAQLAAVGHPDPLPAKIAEDGVEEFLWIARQMRGPEPVAFHASDSGTMFSAGAEPPVVTVSAPASDLVLLLYGRVSADDVLIEGDAAALAPFLVAIG